MPQDIEVNCELVAPGANSGDVDEILTIAFDIQGLSNRFRKFEKSCQHYKSIMRFSKHEPDAISGNHNVFQGYSKDILDICYCIYNPNLPDHDLYLLLVNSFHPI